MGRMLAKLRGRLRGRPRQRLLPFRARGERVERVFRAMIVLATVLGLASLWMLIPKGRSAVLDAVEKLRWAALRRAGLEPERSEVDTYWRERRQERETRTRATFRNRFDALPPAKQAFLRAAGMDRESAVVRWGNYDLTFVLSSKVFARDDDGRYYRLRPNVRSVIFRQFSVFDLDICQFLFPDTPEVRAAAEAAGATVARGTEETTNSWGCRGPEPDLSAPVRGLVLGDSFMQGFFVADDETPPACLEKSLAAALGTKVSILNTGVLGYSPEHYYATLRAFCDRFRPRFVVVSLYANDFGEESAVLRGEGDWIEAQYWLDKIRLYCTARGAICLIVPVPYESQLVGVRNMGHYQGQISNITKANSQLYCDPTEDFVNADLALAREHRDATNRSLLYNGRLGDCHFSPRGSALWGQVVAKRLALLLERQLQREAPSPSHASRADR